MEFMTPERLSLTLMFVQMSIRELADKGKIPATETQVVYLARQFGQAYNVTKGEVLYVLRQPLTKIFCSTTPPGVNSQL